MSSRERALEATRRALDLFEDPNVTVASLVRMCLRVANLRNDAIGLSILRMETVDLQTPALGRTLFPEKVEELSAYLPRAEAHKQMHLSMEARIARMTLPPEPDKTEEVWGGSAATLEASVAMIERRILDLKLESRRLPPHISDQRLENEKIILMLETTSLARRQILERTKTFLFDYLLEAEAELARGQTFAGIFEEMRRFVDDSLTELAPAALDELRAGEERLLEGSAPALSQALMSCRRVLKALADVVYPSSVEPVVGTDGKVRKLGDDQYVNRLLAYAIERTGAHTAGEVFQAGLDALGRRLNALNALANKGVHAVVAAEEAQACFAQTYLLSAEILRLRDRTSTLLDPSDSINHPTSQVDGSLPLL
ncbi:hypothetical protein [Specibacter sp. NPDC078709]|uniref:hypothetical protein n=1 Tax=Specibacter sp. NPDC078709 TaxID=3154364 RepID=UPI003413DAAB